jgi:large subunit ribosomal protein L33
MLTQNQTVKSRTIAVRLVSMALTGYYKTMMRPRTHRPLSMLKYDPVGMYQFLSAIGVGVGVEGRARGDNSRGLGNGKA